MYDMAKRIKRHRLWTRRNFWNHICDERLVSSLHKYSQKEVTKTISPILKKNEQKIYNDTLSKKIYEWQIRTWKDA